jgi:hypothetical protein
VVVSVWIAAGAAAAQVCMPVNGVLRLAVDPSTGHSWGPVVSSNPQVLSCTVEDRALDAGSSVCVPHLPGMVAVSTMTGPPAGSADGRGEVKWELRVTVVGYGLI